MQTFYLCFLFVCLFVLLLLLTHCVVPCSIDIQILEQKAAKEFPMLQFTFTDVQDSKTLIVEDVSGTIQLGYLRLHFETTTGKGSVENVEKLPPNRALITFQSPSCKS